MQRVDTATSSGAIADILTESRTASRNLREATDRLQLLAQSLASSEANLRGAIGKADTRRPAALTQDTVDRDAGTQVDTVRAMFGFIET